MPENPFYQNRRTDPEPGRMNFESRPGNVTLDYLNRGRHLRLGGVSNNLSVTFSNDVPVGSTFMLEQVTTGTVTFVLEQGAAILNTFPSDPPTMSGAGSYMEFRVVENIEGTEAKYLCIAEN